MGIEAKFLCPDVMPDHIDPAIITHGHQDHIAAEAPRTLRRRLGTVVVPRCSRGKFADPSLGAVLVAPGPAGSRGS
jgi:L-ascorbate metabolism protein UlaG (beta-lactamase superfamily)